MKHSIVNPEKRLARARLVSPMYYNTGRAGVNEPIRLSKQGRKGLGYSNVQIHNFHLSVLQ